MAETSFEEARRCPKCKLPGEDRSTQPARGAGLQRGTTVHMVYCVNDRCTWYNTCWVVQVNPDGSVPPPQDHRGQAKVYSGFGGTNDDIVARQIMEALTLQTQAEVKPGGELRNPRA
jgi:hypothetical protein